MTSQEQSIPLKNGWVPGQPVPRETLIGLIQLAEVIRRIYKRRALEALEKYGILLYPEHRLCIEECELKVENCPGVDFSRREQQAKEQQRQTKRTLVRRK